MILSRKALWCSVAALAVGCTVQVLAQGKSDIADSGSLAALTSEVRQLRAAVEESTRSQTQTQALGVYLSAQQSRILQVTTRLDLARKDIEAATLRSRELVSGIASIESDLLRESEPQKRAELAVANQQLKAELQLVAMQEEQARLREVQLSQALQVEESRWTDLISRLEQLIRK